jgi:translation elongation factor EF-Tu-like GTPase
MIHPPTHLYYFSAGTMAKLLEKYGFTIVSITHPGIYRNLKQIVFSLFFLNKNVGGRFSLLLDKLNAAIYLNTYDVMQVVAQKKA